MGLQKITIAEKLALIDDYWHPRIVGELNGQAIKLVKFKGEFVWHHHDIEDELFYVLEGAFVMELEDKSIELFKGDMLVVPKGVRHRPVAQEEVSVLLFEPISTLNTGNVITDLTRKELDRLDK